MRHAIVCGFVISAFVAAIPEAIADPSPIGRSYKVQFDDFVLEDKAYDYTVTLFRPETRVRTVTIVEHGVTKEVQQAYTVLVPYTETRQGTRTEIRRVTVNGQWDFIANGTLSGPSVDPIPFQSNGSGLFSLWNASDTSDSMGWRFYSGLTYYQNGTKLQGNVLFVSPFGIRIGGIVGTVVP